MIGSYHQDNKKMADLHLCFEIVTIKMWHLPIAGFERG